MRFVVKSCAVAALAIFANLATAQTPQINGADHPDYQAAVAEWLAGRDAEALAHLAQLSRDDNAAAQILLARIAARAPLHQHVTGMLSRADRVALLRMPGGLSGKSWLTKAAETAPLAAALLQSTRVGENAAAVTTLLDLGETETALLAASTMVSYGETAVLQGVIDGVTTRLPDDASLALSLWATNYASEDDGSGLVSLEVMLGEPLAVHKLTFSPPRLRSLVEDATYRDTAMTYANQVTSWTPIRQYCERNCA